LKEKYVKKSIRRFYQGCLEEMMDDVVTEYQFTLCVNHKEFVTLSCSPEYLVELAVGHLLSEGVITAYADIASMDIREGIIDIQLNIQHNTSQGLTKKNHMNCVEALGSTTKIRLAWCLKHMETLETQSGVFHVTGGVHRAAIIQEQNFLMMVEDIARHNAVDKVIGATLIQGLSTVDKALVLSGRISSEIVMKAYKAGIPVIISKAASTFSAIALAERLNITVIGFVREGRLNVYSGLERVFV